MDPLLEFLLNELKEKHGEELDLAEHHYFLFLDGGVFDIYLDQDEKEIKVNIQLSDGVKVYYSSKKLEEIMKNS